MKNYIGKKFGRWTVYKFDRTDKGRKYFWWCECQCGNKKSIRIDQLNRGESKSCGCLQKEISSKTLKQFRQKQIKEKQCGEKMPRWKGGRFERRGYWYIWKGFKKYVLEHRDIMEKELGRKLNKTEIVHHINGDKKDNRIENLKIIKNNSIHTELHSRNKKRNKKGQFIKLIL